MSKDKKNFYQFPEEDVMTLKKTPNRTENKTEQRSLIMHKILGLSEKIDKTIEKSQNLLKKSLKNENDFSFSEIDHPLLLQPRDINRYINVNKSNSEIFSIFIYLDRCKSIHNKQNERNELKENLITNYKFDYHNSNKDKTKIKPRLKEKIENIKNKTGVDLGEIINDIYVMTNK